MSTPTPRTDAEAFRPYRGDRDDEDVNADFARTLETELTAALARIAELEKENDEVETQLSDARNGWESALTKVDDVSRQLSEAQAQLASAREDEKLYRELEISITDVQDWSGTRVGDALDAIDSARGVTSPPTSAETVPESTWKSIEMAPKDGTRIIGFSPDWVHEDYNHEGIRECFCDGDGIWYSPDWDNEFDVYQNGKGQPTHWTALPPPPQGKEQGE